MPQTRTVLARALERGLRPIVVVNKIDRPASRIDEAIERLQDLFLELATDADQLEFPVLYAIAREGRAGTEPDPAKLAPDLRPLFETILREVPPPDVDPRDRPRCWSPRSTTTPTGGGSPSAACSGAPSAPATRWSSSARTASETRQKVSALTVFDGLKRRRGRRGRRPARSSPWPGSPTSASAPPWPSPEAPEALPVDRHRGADAAADLRRQHLALRRPRGAVLDLAPAQGAARPRAGDEPLPARRADRASRTSSPSPAAASCTSRS